MVCSAGYVFRFNPPLPPAAQKITNNNYYKLYVLYIQYKKTNT